jgi:CheY-like chemotaxis protein
LTSSVLINGKILIAEDKLINMQVIKTQMEELGQISKCEFSYDGEEVTTKTIEIYEQALEESNEGEVL